MIFEFLLLTFLRGLCKNDARVVRQHCTTAVSTFLYSWKKQRVLTSAKGELNLPVKLVTESSIRWGSYIKIMERVIEQEKAIRQALAADMKTQLLPTWQDIQVLEALKPLEEFTDVLFGEEYVSVCYMKPVLHLLNTEILKSEKGKTGLCEDIKKKVHSSTWIKIAVALQLMSCWTTGSREHK